ncbi:F0F1 ATP synthase subunit epsilon [Algirhabdus cladophorae]|uniref:F0F1 ATP synthase subunit epsilon n=1 Tax=Algirhabdus cladophorae TaxID=3377108 RepID=UPI003B8470A9
MAGTMQFDLVSPERSLASLEVSEVQVPGADGDFTAMPDHAPTISSLRPGMLRVVHAGGTDEYVVSGGFAEVSGTGLSVLAERAVPKAEMTQDIFDQMIEEAANNSAEAYDNEPGPVDEAAKMLADMVAMGSEIGLSAK